MAGLEWMEIHLRRICFLMPQECVHQCSCENPRVTWLSCVSERSLTGSKSAVNELPSPDQCCVESGCTAEERCWLWQPHFESGDSISPTFITKCSDVSFLKFIFIFPQFGCVKFAVSLMTRRHESFNSWFHPLISYEIHHYSHLFFH